MKHTLTSLLLPAIAVLVTGCDTPSEEGPPKTVNEKTAEAREGQVPDPLRDPRPSMPPTGPMFQPMR